MDLMQLSSFDLSYLCGDSAGHVEDASELRLRGWIVGQYPKVVLLRQSISRFKNCGFSLLIRTS
jgi:hypothetical protein